MGLLPEGVHVTAGSARPSSSVVRIVRASQERVVLMSLNDEVFTPDCLVDATHTLRLPHSVTKKVEKERGMGWFEKQVCAISFTLNFQNNGSLRCQVYQRWYYFTP